MLLLLTVERTRIAIVIAVTATLLRILLLFKDLYLFLRYAILELCVLPVSPVTAFSITCSE